MHQHKSTLAIGPANFAGQGAAWAQAVERFTDFQTTTFTRYRTFGFSSEHVLQPVHHGEPRSPILNNEAFSFINRSTHVALDGFIPISGAPTMANLRKDISELQSNNTRLCLIAHGSDIRNPISHIKRVPHSWWRSAGPQYFARTVVSSAKRRQLARQSNLPMLVSTPDLLHDAPDAIWLPVCVDTEALRNETVAFSTGTTPIVLHIPSRRKPAIKGTQVISSTMNRLAARGIIRYLEPEALPHAELLTLMNNVDIVIDQILGDAYGVTSVEAMAKGRLTICSLGATRDLLDVKPPILEATPETLGDLILSIAKNPDQFSSIATQGPRYAEQIHDGRIAAARLLQAFHASQ